jgi:hypothetical protein
MLPNKIGNRALKDHAKAFRIDTPSHDIECSGPLLFAGGLDQGRAAVAGAQNDRGCAVAEQAGRDNVGFV